MLFIPDVVSFVVPSPVVILCAPQALKEDESDWHIQIGLVRLVIKIRRFGGLDQQRVYTYTIIHELETSFFLPGLSFCSQSFHHPYVAWKEVNSLFKKKDTMKLALFHIMKLVNLRQNSKNYSVLLLELETKVDHWG